MTPVEFKSAVVARDDGKITIACFDGAATPVCVALLECDLVAARALRERVGSALDDAAAQ